MIFTSDLAKKKRGFSCICRENLRIASPVIFLNLRRKRNFKNTRENVRVITTVANREGTYGLTLCSSGAHIQVVIK